MCAGSGMVSPSQIQQMQQDSGYSPQPMLQGGMGGTPQPMLQGGMGAGNWGQPSNNGDAMIGVYPSYPSSMGGNQQLQPTQGGNFGPGSLQWDANAGMVPMQPAGNYGSSPMLPAQAQAGMQQMTGNPGMGNGQMGRPRLLGDQFRGNQQQGHLLRPMFRR